jgi:hypothetical protein
LVEIHWFGLFRFGVDVVLALACLSFQLPPPPTITVLLSLHRVNDHPVVSSPLPSLPTMQWQMHEMVASLYEDEEALLSNHMNAIQVQFSTLLLFLIFPSLGACQGAI